MIIRVLCCNSGMRIAKRRVIRFLVHLEPAFGIEAKFEWARIQVMEAVRCEADGGLSQMQAWCRKSLRA